ncbi:MAG: hypothetical protein WBP94_05895 [Rhodomicrobiaceae bacterium]
MFVAADTRYSAIIAAWNLFGIADLVLAIFLGVTSAEGSPLQLFYAPPGSAAMQHLPWSFVPAALVPFWLIVHATIWAQLRERRGRAHGAVRATSQIKDAGPRSRASPPGASSLQIETIMRLDLLFAHDFSVKPVSVLVCTGTGFFPIVL